MFRWLGRVIVKCSYSFFLTIFFLPVILMFFFCKENIASRTHPSFSIQVYPWKVLSRGTAVTPWLVGCSTVRSAVVELVKLIGGRQNHVWRFQLVSCKEMCEADLCSPDQVVIFKDGFACLQAINLTAFTRGDLVFMGGTEFLKVELSPWQMVVWWNILLRIHKWLL